jgi:hypothetical protein
MNRPPYGRADEIAAYTYRAEIYCQACVTEAMIATGDASPAARDMTTADVLDQCADASSIDRTDEHSYDSFEFPKVVFLHQLADGAPCDRCGSEL